MEINKTHQVKSVAFQGHQHKQTDTGAQAYHINCMYDSSKYTCEVECFRVGMDKKNNFFVEKGCDGKMEPFFKTNVPPEGVMLEPRYDLDLEDEQPFAYRLKLTNKYTGDVKYMHEDNNEPDGCTIVTRKGTTVTKQGPMYLAMADTHAPGYVHAGFCEDNVGELVEPTAKQKKEIADKVRKTVRTFGTINGGTMAGLEADIPNMAEAGVERLITTPLMGGATVAADKYWAENNMLMAGGIGTRNNYASLQRQALKYGINLVDDGTFTSEGLQGVHFQRAIKWMDNEDLPDEFYYFRMNGLKDTALGLGVVPENMENLSCKLVNAPFDVVLKKDGSYDMPENKDYDPERPTEFQIFDDTMVSDEQRKDKKNVITKYDKTTPDGNKLAINTHDDTAQPYHFIVDANELKKNVLNLNEVNKARNKADKVRIDSPKGTMFIGALSGISMSPKTEGGFVCWNANTDITKFNYFTSNYDNELISDIKNPAQRAIEMDKLRRANCQVQDMATAVARYRTNWVRNIHEEYFAKTIGEISSNPAKAYERLEGLMNTQNPKKPILPEGARLSKEVVANVIEDNYEMRPKLDDYHELVIQSLMDLPLDSIEFAPEVQGALSSPYLSKLSPDNDHIGETRYDAMNDPSYKVPQKYAKTYNKVNDVFVNDIKEFADKVLQEVDKNSKEKLFTSDGQMTEYGQYLIPLVGQDIARYAVTKALMPTAKAKQMKNGEIVYDYEDMTKRGTLEHMNINGDSQQDEANQIANRMHNGVKRLMNDNVKFVAKSINKRFENTNANSLKLAEVMVNRGGFGLDWRFDAAKDVADFDSVKNGAQRFDTAWKNNITFWSNMVNAIKGENPHSYTVAELTDVDMMITDSMPDDARNVIYDSEGKAIGSLLDLAGITSEANYSYFFDGISDMFGYSYVTGNDAVGNNDSARVSKLEDSLSRFAAKPIDYKRNSYTFASNHDKPRMVHCLSMDMSLFHADLNNKADFNHRKTAYMIMNDKMPDSMTDYDWNIVKNSDDYFNNASSKAVANGELLRNSIGDVNSKLKFEACEKIKNTTNSQKDYDAADRKYDHIYEAMSKAVADVVNGNYYKNVEDKAHGKSTPDSLKKVNEKDGFGTKPVADAFDIIYDQAVHKYNDGKELLSKEELLEYRNRVDSKATEVGRAKTRIIMRYLGALAGNPTVYAGDEFGMTGYEDKCGNTYLQNRQPIDRSIIDKNSEYYRQDIADYRQDIRDISAQRKSDEMNIMEALNNGTMYKLDKQKGSNGNECSAVIAQASNGAMNISVFNPNGISTDPKVPIENLHPTNMNLESIYLKGSKGKISLTPGTTFKNVNPKDTATYKVYNNGDEYFIRKDYGDLGADIELNETTAPDGVMMLYHLPDKVEKERTELVKSKKYYNPVHNIPQSNAYQGKPKSVNGENIDLTSKN